ncbi:DsbA family protein [Halopseudomonas salegens]|uniref:Protein-disulfide isomerase n=1 Tax=Halopseudomonas salegens TaxID=1434072 RepID=A0A1H2EUX0_9GAMM|nr:thioredoxin domain-containing protein [Halopseudomonas salegens]SDT98900.1 Protein-disulfide isomerase [Halopseudomonas salegens]
MGEARQRKDKGEPTLASRQRKRQQFLIWGGGSLLVVAVIALAIYLATPGTGPVGGLPQAAEGASPFPSQVDQYGVQLGDPDAPVVVREFADYQCPACANFSRLHADLKAEYIDSGQVRLVFFDMPLSQHRNSLVAAQAARCAGAQNRYWEMHDQLFARQSGWSLESDPVETFTGYAEDLDLNAARFSSCLRREQRLDEVEASMRVARQLQVASTPTVFVDNIHLPRPAWEVLSGVIDRELAAAESD